MRCTLARRRRTLSASTVALALHTRTWCSLTTNTATCVTCSVSGSRACTHRRAFGESISRRRCTGSTVAGSKPHTRRRQRWVCVLRTCVWCGVLWCIAECVLCPCLSLRFPFVFSLCTLLLRSCGHSFILCALLMLVMQNKTRKGHWPR